MLRCTAATSTHFLQAGSGKRMMLKPRISSSKLLAKWCSRDKETENEQQVREQRMIKPRISSSKLLADWYRDKTENEQQVINFGQLLVYDYNTSTRSTTTSTNATTTNTNSCSNTTTGVYTVQY